jgi:N-acetyl-gamma-glutamyl-phosphate reductase
MSKTPVAILGPTGYTGLELIELIARHPSMTLEYLASARTPGPRIDAEFPRLRGRMGGASPQCEPIDHDSIAARCKGGLAFLCLPHEAAMLHTPELLTRGVKVVDLSAAYRIKDIAVYEKAYGHHHTDHANLAHAVYGLTEIAREQVKGATLVANPGCYPTAAAIAILPLLRAGVIDSSSIIINAASGVSGAGREPKPHTTLVEAGENYSAYGIGTHRHQPEINQTLHLHGKGPDDSDGGALFVPHLLPIERGILETIYARPSSPHVDTARVMEILTHAYAKEPFVTVRAEAPMLRDVNRTNQVHVNARVIGGRVVVVAAIDNLVKGASGQAVQNANVMLGLEETAGLA